MLVLRSGCDGRGGKPRGGRVKVLGLVLTDGWKSLITSSVSFCVMNLSARLIVFSLAWDESPSRICNNEILSALMVTCNNTYKIAPGLLVFRRIKS